MGVFREKLHYARMAIRSSGGIEMPVVHVGILMTQLGDEQPAVIAQSGKVLDSSFPVKSDVHMALGMKIILQNYVFQTRCGFCL